MSSAQMKVTDQAEKSDYAFTYRIHYSITAFRTELNFSSTFLVSGYGTSVLHIAGRN
jgi:hypothetical protein